MPLSLLLPGNCCNTLTVSHSGWLAAVSVDSTKIYVSQTRTINIHTYIVYKQTDKEADDLAGKIDSFWIVWTMKEVKFGHLDTFWQTYIYCM